MKLSVEIDLGGEAMRRATDARDAIFSSLQQEAERFTGDLRVGWHGTIRDANASAVGTWEVTA